MRLHPKLSKALPLLFITGLFALSLWFRMDNFNRAPLGNGIHNIAYERFTNYEVDSHVLFVLDVYQDESPAKHKFAGYIGKNAEFPNNDELPLLSVYTSFSPVMFIVPGMLVELFGMAVSFNNLQIFSLAIHFITTLLLYGMVRAFLPRKRPLANELMAIFAAGVYIFSLTTLHNHMSVYWAHQLLMPVYLGALWRFALKRGELSWKEAAAWAAAMSVIAWTGVFGAIGFFIYYVLQYRKAKERAWRDRALATIGGSVVAVGLIILHVVWVTGTGLADYFSTITGRVSTRSINVDYLSTSTLIRLHAKALWLDFAAYVTLLVTFLGYAAARPLKQEGYRFQWAMVAITLMPLIESLPLLEHDTVFGFGRLKHLVPLLLAICLIGYQIFEKATNRRKAAIVVAAIFIAVTIPQLYHYQKMYGYDAIKSYERHPSPVDFLFYTH